MHTSYRPNTNGTYLTDRSHRKSPGEMQLRMSAWMDAADFPHKVVHNRDKSAVSIFPWYLLSLLGRVFILRRPMWYYRKHIAPPVWSNTQVERILAWPGVDTAKVLSTIVAMAGGPQL